MSAVRDVLEDVREYLDDRADADCQGDPPRMVPNRAMQLLMEVDAVLKGLPE